MFSDMLVLAVVPDAVDDPVFCEAVEEASDDRLLFESESCKLES